VLAATGEAADCHRRVKAKEIRPVQLQRPDSGFGNHGSFSTTSRTWAIEGHRQKTWRGLMDSGFTARPLC